MLITLLVLVLVLIAVWYIVSLIPDPKLARIAWVVAIVLCIVWLINRLGGSSLVR